MERRVAMFDLDKTIYNDHSFFGGTKHLVDTGIIAAGCWTEIEDQMKLYKQKVQDYSSTANNLLTIFGKYLKGIGYEKVVKATQDFFEIHNKDFYGYFAKVVPELMKTHDVYLVTTNSQMVAEVIVEKFGLTGFLSSEFEVKDGLFTGDILSSFAGGKYMAVSLVEKYGKEGSIAVGDSENDVEMLELVEKPACFQPSEELLDIAKQRGWLVVDEQSAEKAILGLVE